MLGLKLIHVSEIGIMLLTKQAALAKSYEYHTNFGTHLIGSKLNFVYAKHGLNYFFCLARIVPQFRNKNVNIKYSDLWSALFKTWNAFRLFRRISFWWNARNT